MQGQDDGSTANKLVINEACIVRITDYIEYVEML